MLLVLDTSNNDPITEQEFKQSGAVALISKATEAASFEDKTLATQRDIAAKSHVPFGSYLFLHPGTKGNEALYYLDYAKPRKGDIEPIIDAETVDGETWGAIAARVDSCAKALEEKGYRPILYASASFWQNLYAARPTLRRLRVWEADYPGRFTRWFPWLAKQRIRLMHRASVVLWQWTDNYAVGNKHFDASKAFVPLSTLLIR